jgi:DNA-binding NarL/FixJ family response regulator
MTRVVLADDQELVRSGLRSLLEARGIDVLGEAANGREALALARARQPDVLVMDIRMPVLDGIAATRELTTTASSTRVLCCRRRPSRRTSTGCWRSAACAAGPRPCLAYETGLVRPGAGPA